MYNCIITINNNTKKTNVHMGESLCVEDDSSVILSQPPSVPPTTALTPTSPNFKLYKWKVTHVAYEIMSRHYYLGVNNN